MPQVAKNVNLFRRLLVQALVLPVLLLMLLAAGLIWQIGSLLAAAQWVDHTDQVIASANHVFTVLEDAENGERAYITIGNHQFAQQYFRASKEAGPAFDRLRHLVADNSSQKQRLDHVRAIYGQWAIRAARKVSRYGDDATDVRARYVITEDKEPMDEMRHQFGAFIATEQALRDRRVTFAGDAAMRAFAWTVAGAIVAAVLLGLVTIVLVRRATGAYAKALAESRKNASLLHSTIHGIGDAVLVTDAFGRITQMNPVAERLTGWTSAEALGNPAGMVFPIFNETTREPVESPVDRVIRDNAVAGLANHTILVHRDGHDIPIDDSGAPIRDSAGNLIGVVLVFRDIAERRTAERALAVSEERLRLALESARMGWWEWDIRTNDLAWSDNLEAVHGMAPGSFDGTFEGFARVVHPEDRQSLHDAINQAIETRSEFSVNFRVPWPDGGFHWIAGEGQAFHDEEGNPLRMVGLGRDVTESRRAQEELRESEERFRRIADSMPQIVWTMRADGRVEYLNQGWYEFTGMTIEEALEFGWESTIHSNDLPQAAGAMNTAIQAGKPCEVEYRLKRHDGVFRWCLGRSVPVRDERGEVVRWVGTGTDIDDQKRAEVAILETAQDMARLHEREYHIANQLQEALQREYNIANQLQGALQPPRSGITPGFVVRDYYKAALEEANVGGDFFDVFPIDDGRSALVVGDLSGKGLAAAAQVATVRNMLRYCLYTERNMAEAIGRLNRVVTGNHLITGFATLFVGIYESESRTLSYVCCGQEPALVHRASRGEIEQLSATGPILGSWEDAAYTQQSVILDHGDALAIFTDGLTEAGPTRRDMLGIEGVSSLLSLHALGTAQWPSHERAEELVSSIINSVNEFGKEGVRDDVCLLVGVVDTDYTGK